ncbi:saccharopine dehydrogenase NADP-binding domain-containing protein [Streptomyces roseirectus]|uniref:Saccharopine dehydrogenase NADP-binding domain-containing protein n=1 Tax=Streptomyces roseirectus TaxID=2768066 RepID=A0A7H0IS58_9ACTN|nr:saccharopine dehydrogenase NADP-binding domain-containing protein [Streptomyces roseirectus]
MGAGLSTGSGLTALTAHADRVRLWHRTADRAAEVLDRLGIADRAEPRAHTPGALAAELTPGDVVVSMLPASEHPALLATCLAGRAHFACSSYVTGELLAQGEAARAAGLTVLTEAGLDPGIDHLFAHSLVSRARAEIGAENRADYALTSYCGGLPAVPNSFRYRFSWAPLGVLNALRSPARHIEGGAEKVTAHPWEATRELALGAEVFEAYPNRDSVPFIAQYDLPPGWHADTFVRGTLRLDGWQHAWAPVFAELKKGDDARIAELAGELARTYPTTRADRDRVVLSVSLTVRGANGRTWSGSYLLDRVGTAEESAMAHTVSRPLALGVRHILDSSLPPGLSRGPETAVRAEEWLNELAEEGLEFTMRVG